LDRKKALIMRIIISINVIIVLFGAICLVIAFFCPDLLSAIQSKDINLVRDTLLQQDSHATGVVISLAQMAQLFSIVIPSMPLHVAAGLVLGPFKGILYSCAGFVIASTLMYVIARKMGRFVGAGLEESEKFKKFAFLANPKHPVLMTLIAYIFPFIPNGIIPYIAAKANIRVLTYAYISLLGGLPTIIVYNCVGYLLLQRNYFLTVLLVLAMLALSVVMFFLRDKLTEFTRKLSGR
jgi:uncharacterized membrane protein YdjX (TVP38/TMEM64 family)